MISFAQDIRNEMTEFQPKKRVIDLSGQLQRFSQAYYCGTSQIEDEAYDQLKEELHKLEFEFQIGRAHV